MATRRRKAGQKDVPLYSTWTGLSGSWKTLSDLLGQSAMPAPASLADALCNTVFLLCSDIIAQDIAKAKLRMFRRVDDVRRVEVKPSEHPIADLLAYRPNPWHSWPEAIEMVVRHLAITQNAFFAKRITTRGDLRELIPVVPSRVTIYVDRDDAELYYDILRPTTFEEVVFRQFPQRLDAEKIIHIRGRMVNGLEGYSSLMAGGGTLALASAIQTYQNRLYTGGGSHKVVFTLNEDEELSQEQFERLRKQFVAMQRKAIDGEEPLVLENGADVKMLTMTAKDSEVATTQKLAIVETCRLFRMPPHKVMHLEAVKYENLGQLERTYVSDTLLPYATKVEEALRLGLLTRDELGTFSFEFDRDEMTASDAITRAEIAKIGVQSGVLEVDEARRELGYDPLPGSKGQVRMVPVNVSVLDRDNKVVVDGTAAAAGGDDGAQSTDPKQQPAKPPAKLLAFPNS